VSITFSATEVAELEAAFDALLSPDANPDSGWHARMSDAVRRACRADRVLFTLPQDPFVRLFSEGHDPRMLREYAEYYYGVDPGNERIAKRGLTVYNQRMVVAHEVQTFLRSEIYADMFIPYRIRDCLGMSVGLDPATRDRGDGVSLLTLHSETAEYDAFGERGLTVLRLLRPAFCAGVAGRVRLAALGTDLSQGLSRLEDGVRVVGAGGEIVYENPSLHRTLAAAPRGELDVAIARIAAGVRSPSPLSTDAVRGDRAGCAYEVIRSGGATYHLHGIRVRPGMLGAPDAPPYAVVNVHRDDPGAEILRRLGERFGLTQRESQVALLLAHGETNKKIATTLKISPNTARHHTEHVLAKLGVDSRAKVTALLLSVV
jgi:DNA-binding CsgD family transcriptional regulator